MGIESLYTPSKWGQEFHALTTNEALGAGAAGPGKSFVLLMDPITQLRIESDRCSKSFSASGVNPESDLGELMRKNPLASGYSTGWALHLRRTSNMLTQTLGRANRIFKAIDPKVRFDSQLKIYQFSCGFRYQFGHCQHSDDWDIHMSNEYTHIAFDELVQFEEEQYEQIKMRLRSADPVLSHFLKVRAMSNPVMRLTATDNFTVSNPQWVRQKFVEPAPQGRVILKETQHRRDGSENIRTRVYLPATLYDNPDPAFVKQYEATLLHAKPHIRQACLYGDWFVSAGSYHADEWDSNIHTCKKFLVPPDWPVFRTMDWGYKNPGVIHWWALDEDDTLYCIREYSFKLKTATEVAKEIRRLEKQMGLWGYGGSRISGPADTQLWEKRGESGASKAEEMAAIGVDWDKADKKSRKRNAERISERLCSHGNYTQAPGLVLFQSCHKLIETLPAIQTDPKDLEVPADGGEDHWYDSCMYACAHASHGREGIPVPLEDEAFHEDDPFDGVSPGQYGYGGH